MNKIYNNEIISRFIVLQPIIDIVTSLLINELSMSISLGMLIRFLFLVYAGIYLLKSKNKKILTFLVLLFIYCITSLIGNYYVKTGFSIFTHLVFLVKMVYFPVTLLFFYTYFKAKKLLNSKVFIHISIIMGLSLILSLITNTSYCSYVEVKKCIKGGVVGWFNSANEISVILSSLLGLTLINYLKKGKKLSYIVMLIVVAFLCVIGTKTAILAIVGILLTYVVYYLLSLIKGKYKIIMFKRVLSVLPILIVLILLINVLPIHYNLVESYKYASTELIKEKENEYETDQKEEYESKYEEENKNEIIYNQIIFQGRSDYIAANKKIYLKSSIFSKLFGITNQGNYYENNAPFRINERDFHDSIMLYGIVGFILIMILPFVIFVKIIINIKKNIEVLLNDEFIILGITTGLVLGISYLAGHVLFQPAVCIYFSYLIVALIKKSEVCS